MGGANDKTFFERSTRCRLRPRLRKFTFLEGLAVDIVPINSETDLGPAAKALVEKIGDAIGAAWEPVGKVLNAYADVKVDEIKAVGGIKIEATRRRAIERVIAEETKKQENLEAIYGKTFALLEPSTSPETIRSIDDDWLVAHSEKARLASDDEMQNLWAKILAKQANKPGSFNKRCLNVVSVLEKYDAEYFTSLCRFVVHDIARPLPAILSPMTGLHSVYTQNGIEYISLHHLHTLGLIRFSTPILEENIWWYGDPRVQLQYFEEQRTFRISSPDPKRQGKYPIKYGAVAFTDIGEQLSRIAGAKPVPGFLDYLESEWVKAGVLREP